MDEKVEYYFEKFLDCREKYLKTRNFPTTYTFEFKKLLNKMINNGEEHLLTEAFIDYLGSLNDPMFDLRYLNHSMNFKIEIIMWYMRNVELIYCNRDSEVLISKTFPELLTEDIKKASLDIHNLLNLLKEKNQYTDLLEKSILTIFAYCYVSNKLDKLPDVIRAIEQDPTALESECDLNNIIDSTDAWYNRLIVYTNNIIGNKRVIS